MTHLLALYSPTLLLLVALGVVGGIVFGVIPGMTATMAVAVFLPITYALNIYQALALLLGLYVGGISGGLVPAILLNIPGTPSSITTTFDGYPMAQRGEGVRGLKIGVLASVIGGLFSAAALFFFAPALASVAIKFTYVEKFLIILFALSVIASLSKGSMLMGVFSGVLGIFFSLIGSYGISEGGNGKTRLMFEFMKPFLRNGFSLLPVLIGLFAISTILSEAEKGMKEQELSKVDLDHAGKFHISDFAKQYVNLFRSAVVGTFVGLLPGVGGSAASILSYTQAKNFAKDRKKMGTGIPTGIIASETANNALTGGALIPLLSLAIPGDSTTAILIGAFTLQGLQVGPLFISHQPHVWNNMMISLVLANLVMFFIMFFGVKYVAKVIYVPKYILYPIIFVMSVVGAYAVNYGIFFDVVTLLLFGVFMWAGVKVGLQIPPLLIGFILGRQAEVYFVKSLESYGSYAIFFTKSPIAVFLWVLIAISIGWTIHNERRQVRTKRAESEGKTVD